MDELLEPCAALATVLAAADDPEQLLPAPLPCERLELLLALHGEVRQAMLADLPRAARAAAAARLVAAGAPDDAMAQAQAAWSSGNAVLHLPDYPAALAHYDAALAHFAVAAARCAPEPPARDVRPVLVNRVFCLSELGRYDEAQRAVVAAQAWLDECPNGYAQATLLLNRSQLAGAMGDNAAMVALADETIALATALAHPDRAAQAWVNRASGCVWLGRYAEADEAARAALELAEALEDPLTAARAHMAQAMLLQAQGRLFAALAALRRVEAGFAQADNETATLLLETAAVSAQLQQWDEALVAASSAARQFAAQGLPAYSAWAALRAARFAAQRGRAQDARRMLELAREQLRDDAHPFLAAEVALAEAMLATLPHPVATPRTLERQRKAVRSQAQAAVDRLRRSGFTRAAEQGLLVLADLEALLGRKAEAAALFRQLAASDSPDLRMAALNALGALLPPDEALPCLETAAALAVEQRRALPMEELQARYSSETAPAHMGLAACALALGLPERVAAAVWEAKAGPLLDLRAAGAGNHSAGANLEAARSELSRLRRVKDGHERDAQLAISQGQHQRAEGLRRLAEKADAALRERGAALTTQLRALGDRVGRREVPTLAEVQAQLRPGMALLEWFQVERRLYAMLLTAAGPPVVRQVAEARVVSGLLERWSLVVGRYGGAAQAQGAPQLQQLLHPIAALLLGPWRAELSTLDELLLAPFGALAQLPWCALSALEQQALTLSLTPSGAFWAAPPEPSSAAPAPPRVLGYAGTGAQHLAHVAHEIAAVAAMLPGAQLLPEASSADLKAEPPPRLLHIAAHAHTHQSAPLCSSIELADGPFLVHEAHRLNLRGTRLAVLSACETAARPEHGELALALAGAFLCAGAGAVVASLWPVDDAATAALMRAFYTALAAGQPPAAALRRAQLAVREAFPLDWMAFQLWTGSQEATLAL